MLRRGMATRRFPALGLRGALLSLGLVLLAPARALAEPWHIALAKRIVGMATLSVETLPKPIRVRIGVLYDPRRSGGRDEVELQLGAFKSMAPGMSGNIDFDFEAVPVDVEAPLAAAFATRGFRIVVLPETLGDAEWKRVLALAEQHHVGTVAAIPGFLHSPEQVKRLGPSTFVFLVAGGTTGLFSDRDRVAVEGVFGAGVLLNAPLVNSEQVSTPPAPPAPSAPPAPASGVAP